MSDGTTTQNKYITCGSVSQVLTAMINVCDSESRVNDQLSDRSIIGRTEIVTIIGLERGCSPTHVHITTRTRPWSDVAFWDIPPENQCPKTAVFGQNGRISDTAYSRRPEAETDVESGLQEYLFVALPRLQTLTTNDLVYYYYAKGRYEW